jgi:H+/Cl- antiporter ClcA
VKMFTLLRVFERRKVQVVTLALYLTAALATGAGCYLFMRGFEFMNTHRLDYRSVGLWCWITTPVLFIGAVCLIRFISPFSAGTGIPQAIFAAQHFTKNLERKIFPLVSPLALIIKILAVYIVVLAGASVGREGPTVQVATCFFVGLLLLGRRFTGIPFDMRSAVVAGGAAGLAAAFNAPLAGVTFAVEELTVDYFSSIKDYVLLGIICAAIAAKSLTGEYIYFGKAAVLAPVKAPMALLVGVVCGGAGALFSTLLLRGTKLIRGIQWRWGWMAIPVLLSFGVLLMATIGGPDVLGPGNGAAQSLIQGQFGSWTYVFFPAKMLATLLSYLAGAAGGIFAPSLSMGSAFGAILGHWFNSPPAGCAVVGMAAFLSGAIQAPITAFVIIFEMTGSHDSLIPIMLASLAAFMTARLSGAQHLYKTLAAQYDEILQEKPMEKTDPS